MPTARVPTALGKGDPEPMRRSADRGARNHLVAMAGEHLVVGELNRRNAYAFMSAGSMPGYDIVACDLARTRAVYIQVKTRRSRSGAWHSSTKEGRPNVKPRLEETKFWVLVDLHGGDLNTPPRYFIVPDWWMRNNIHENHAAYVAKHGGTRARNPKSQHYAIRLDHISDWEGGWEVLKLF
jgi:hypothetical protein